MVSHLVDTYQKYLERLTVKELEALLEQKKKNEVLKDLLAQKERLRHELRQVEEQIGQYEDKHLPKPEAPSVITGVGHRKTLKDYIVQVLSEAGKPLSPSEIQKRLPGAGYVSTSTNPRSFYNTVFQALQRYDVFVKGDRKYGLARTDSGGSEDRQTRGRLKDYIVQVLRDSRGPLKATEIASRVLIAGYKTDLGIEDLNQRVTATLKKYLNKDFDWDSQRYRLANGE